jgi:hypothetical protein
MVMKPKNEMYKTCINYITAHCTVMDCLELINAQQAKAAHAYKILYTFMFICWYCYHI